MEETEVAAITVDVHFAPTLHLPCPLDPGSGKYVKINLVYHDPGSSHFCHTYKGAHWRELLREKVTL